MLRVMRIAFFGTGEFAAPALRALLAAGHEIRAVVSQPDRPAGRGLVLKPTAVRSTALELNLPHTQSADVNAQPTAELLAGAEAAVIVAFGQKIGPSLLAAAPRGFINIHGSLLPKYRGAAPIQWAVIHGEAESGVTTFRLNERWDAGPILGQRSTPIGPTETADELHDRLAALGAELIVETMAQVERGDERPTAQDRAAGTRAPKLTKADGFVDWSQPARRVAARINGLWSWPAARALLIPASGKPCEVLLARARAQDDELFASGGVAPGAFDDARRVRCGAGVAELLEIKPVGGRLMSLDEFARGRDLRPPARLEAAP